MANIHYHYFTSNWDFWMSHFRFIKILTSDNSMKAQDCMVLSAMSGSFLICCSNQPNQMSGPSCEQLDPRWSFRTASNPTNSRSLNNPFPVAGWPKWSRYQVLLMLLVKPDKQQTQPWTVLAMRPWGRVVCWGLLPPTGRWSWSSCFRRAGWLWPLRLVLLHVGDAHLQGVDVEDVHKKT